MSNRSRELEEEAVLATQMLSGKTVGTIWRHRKGEVAIQFTDGTRLFIDGTVEGVELSITGIEE